MASRFNVADLRRGEAQEFSSVAGAMVPLELTPQAVDTAVESVFKDFRLDPDTEATLKSLMAGDTSSGVAHAYFDGVAAAGLQRAQLAARKRELVIRYVLTEEQMVLLTSYAPDFKLVFRPTENHDHPMAAACRLVDRALVEGHLPPVGLVKDVGGAVSPHISSGSLGAGVHVCAPVVDPKDPARAVLAEMRAKAVRDSATSSERQVAAAKRYLAGDEAAVCGKRAQDCGVQALALSMVHVYDVPMEDIPAVMEKAGASVLEGCLTFPQGIYGRPTGTMKVSGARYEIDLERNKFRMGFEGSPAWWYEHEAVAYLRYGVDQVLAGRTGRYSYKLTERRGDTIFFRVLRVEGAFSSPRQHYKLPGVKMVRVQGYALSVGGMSLTRMARRDYLFPEPLWEDMLGHATLMFERGSLDHEKLYNYYRTVAPRQTINATRVAGGYEVPLRDLVPLIVHVVMAAAAAVLKTRLEVDAHLSSEVARRARERESTLLKALKTFGDGLYASTTLVFYPLKLLADKIDSVTTSVLSRQLLEWEPLATTQEVNLRYLVSAEFLTAEYGREDPVEDAFAEAAPGGLVLAAAADPAASRLMLELFPEGAPGELVQAWQEAVNKQSAKEAAERAEQESARSAVGVRLPAVGHVETVSSDAGVPEKRDVWVNKQSVPERKASIAEAVVEVEMEMRKTEAACADAFRSLTSSGVPDAARVAREREAWGNPVFFRAENGILCDMDGPLDEFNHAAVFVPVAPEGAHRVVPIVSEASQAVVSGRQVEREYHRLAVGEYTGYVLATDALLIYNGPEIVQSLQAAVERCGEHRVTLFQGPPGCGKTTQIVKEAKPTDVVLCPARKAASETRERLVAAKPEWRVARLARDRVRTTDSYLRNKFIIPAVGRLKCERLLADEAFMTREGHWHAAATLLGAGSLMAYGDAMQIPHVPRAQCPKNYLRLTYDEVVTSFRTYRCPPTNVACWGHVYGWKVRSCSAERGEVEHVARRPGAIPDGCVMMGMYQSDKKELQRIYGKVAVRIKIMTVHESQGNTYEHVWLHRFDTRKRSDTTSLYDKPEYVLVAMSRNTKSFKYIGAKLGDLVEKWIELGKNPRRVAAAAHVESEGEKREFL